MKKVMLFTVALLFSLGASAANITINNTFTSNATFSPSSSTNNAPLAIFAWSANATATATDVSIENTVTTDADTPAKALWVFNPSVLSGTVTWSNSLGGGGTFNVASLNSSSYVFDMLAGVFYHTEFVGSVVGGDAISLSVQAVQAVPIPATLWLFAPALMGLLGLRRKSKDLVVA